jgi:hypothetical protein
MQLEHSQDKEKSLRKEIQQMKELSFATSAQIESLQKEISNL